MADELQGKKIAILVANEGIEQVELTEPRKALEEAGADVDLVAPEAGEVQAFDHLDKADTFPVDVTVADADASSYDGLVRDDVRVESHTTLRSEADPSCFRTFHSCATTRRSTAGAGKYTTGVAARPQSRPVARSSAARTQPSVTTFRRVSSTWLR